MNNILFRIFCVFSLSLSGHAVAETADLKILGWVENAYLPGTGMKMIAKLDTGAETSSLDAQIIKKFRKDGKRWVRFAIIDRDTGQEATLVRQRVRTIGVVRHDGSSQTRPVVVMEICVGGLSLTTEVSLIDRSEFSYPLLLGRRALSSVALVDPDSEFLGDTGCGPETDPAVES